MTASSKRFQVAPILFPASVMEEQKVWNMFTTNSHTCMNPGSGFSSSDFPFTTTVSSGSFALALAASPRVGDAGVSDGGTELRRLWTTLSVLPPRGPGRVRALVRVVGGEGIEGIEALSAGDVVVALPAETDADEAPDVVLGGGSLG